MISAITEAKLTHDNTALNAIRYYAVLNMHKPLPSKRSGAVQGHKK